MSLDKELDSALLKGWILECLYYDEEKKKYLAEVSDPEGNTHICTGASLETAIGKALKAANG